MAEIYLARVSGLGGFEKNVVVKRILPQLATDRQFIEMFLDEARIAATLQHPNIVQMYDIGAADGNYFIAMEFLHGEDVRSIMRALNKRKEPLPMAEALNVLIGVSAGLHYAHERRSFDGKPLGIIHRDVTPQNVIVTYDGTIKLVDFGIAKASNRLNETRYGTLKGKIAYMSPEQCQGAVLDRRSDIYALGIMLYELTTNMRLYKGGSDFEIMKQIVEQPVIPPTVRRPRYPVELEHIVMRALEKAPNERYQTAQALQADLEALVRDQRLVVSTIALSSFMHTLFSDQIQTFERLSGDDEQLARELAAKHDSSSRRSSSVSAVDATALGVDVDLDELEELDADLEDDGKQTTVTPVSSVSMSALDPLPEPAPPRRWKPFAALAAVLLVGIGAWFGRGALSGGDSAAPAPSEPLAALAAPPDAGPAPAPDAAIPTVGSVQVVSSPEGAAITVDGHDSGLRSPATLDDLAPGTHTLVLSSDGHLDRELEVEVTAGDTAIIEAELEPKPVARAPPKSRSGGARKPPPKKQPPGIGELRIASRPSCEVIIDGVARGQTPIAGLKLSAGKHRMQLINSRFGIDKTYTVVIKANDVVKKRYTFDLE